jgi:predicted dehydrogenase
MTKKQIRFGIIGLGLMGREFGSAAARWMHLLDLDFQPVITGVCDTNEALFDWFTANFETVTVKTTDYRDLLDSDEIDAIYCAVPHNLHQQFYTDIIRSGKALLGEKPFGMDKAQNDAILAVLDDHPDAFVRCSSEFPFYPGAQRVIDAIRDNAFGKIIDVEAGFLHSSDINPNKTINWKRMIEVNGEYGCMGDLGLHVFHIPLRFGWMPSNVRALLSNIMTERFNAEGETVPCETWDNATLACEVETDDYGNFPMTLKTYRIAPGETNTWYIRVTGTRQSISYSTRYPKSLYTLAYEPGGKQLWAEESLGYDTAYKAITGGIFEFGLPDSLLQMWAAFCDELTNGRSGMKQPFYCATPEETAQHHVVLTAALESQRTISTVTL